MLGLGRELPDICQLQLRAKSGPAAHSRANPGWRYDNLIKPCNVPDTCIATIASPSRRALNLAAVESPAARQGDTISTAAKFQGSVVGAGSLIVTTVPAAGIGAVSAWTQ